MKNDSDAFTPDSPSKLLIFRHNCYSFGMDCTQVSVLEKTDKKALRGLLEGKHGLTLETKITLVLEGDLPHKPLKRKLPNQKLRLKKSNSYSQMIKG